MTIDCPYCNGGSVTIQTTTVGETYATAFHVIGRDLPIRHRITQVAFCDACEFCGEIQPNGTVRFEETPS